MTWRRLFSLNIEPVLFNYSNNWLCVSKSLTSLGLTLLYFIVESAGFDNISLTLIKYGGYAWQRFPLMMIFNAYWLLAKLSNFSWVTSYSLKVLSLYYFITVSLLLFRKSGLDNIALF